MAIFITGSSGFIGSRLISVLEQRQMPVTRILREAAVMTDASGVTIEWPAGLAGLDLSGAKAIVHLATDAITQGRTESEYLRTNLEPVKLLISNLRRSAPNSLFVFISSQSARASAANWYGRSKWEIENYLKGTGHPYVIIRPALVYGDGCGGLAAKIEQLVLRSPVVPVIDGGRMCLQLISVTTLCEAIVKVIESPQELGGQVYELAEETVTLREWIQKIAGSAGKNPYMFSVPSSLIRLFLRSIRFVFPSFPITESNLDGLLAVRLFDSEPSMRRLELLK
jgi:nucleoside-diphosphate-sugar epimerase